MGGGKRAEEFFAGEARQSPPRKALVARPADSGRGKGKPRRVRRPRPTKGRRKANGGRGARGERVGGGGGKISGGRDKGLKEGEGSG